MRHFAIALFILSTIVAGSIAARADDKYAGDRAALLQGVTEIAAPGVPGPLVLTSEHAFAVVAGAAERDIHAPVVAAGRLGRGRVVVFGHTGYADAETLAIADTRALMTNSLNWAAAREGNRASPRIGVFSAELASALRPAFPAVEVLAERDWTGRLTDLDAIYTSQRGFSDAEIDAIREFVRGGKGLVACGLGWGWLQLNPGRTLRDHPLNRILDGSGIYIADGTLDRTGKNGFSCEKPVRQHCHALPAVDAVASGDKGRFSKYEMQQAAWTAVAAVRALPPSDNSLRPKLEALRKGRGQEPIPTEKNPITAADGVARLLLTMQFEDLRSAAPDQVRAHPAAGEFPGPVPSKAKEVARSIEINCGIPDWQGTGLYAAPGRPIRVTAPPSATGAKLRIRIGAHSDELWDKDKWSRVPEITLEAPLAGESTTVCSPFGGPVYVVVPANCKLGRVDMTIDGAVEMPRFVLDATTAADWKERIRTHPAPWGELETSKIILTLPSRVLRDLDDPTELMRFWDRILDAHATLATIPLKRKRPERMVADVQISAGYMHSGYPIMTHLDVDRAFVNLEALRRAENIWGFVHELGHNHQAGDWTFEGTGEVTCNLFSLYAIDTVCSPPPGKRGHDAVDKPPSLPEFVARGAKFDEWKREPFLALHMYVQLQREFGWDTFKRVFAEYRDLPRQQRPESDAAKRDQWLVRFSRACGRNLGPFFVAWGVPTSEEARRTIADLPEWMPADFPK